ncbi:hypothetical protein C2G38_2202026 [Gigaspora rosea]|uniref:C2H2-type domain-containing protein n=1 Tax=Gigaspora rosea TaxID=44941 RepID=A0A397UNY8_9GLOM|nr:hypothetical protein C2G38_2202026 [Gigaspora rosea]
MSATDTLTRFRCSICNSKKTYKSKAGLQRHENLKHSNYKEIPAHISLVPEYELRHIKNVIVKELQKRLKNHYSKVGKQVFSIHCSENSFVGIFGQYLTWYSVCGGWYQCFFDGEEAIDQLTEIFEDSQWEERNYGNGQLSWVKLYENESDKIKETDHATLEPKKKFHFEKGLLIEWRIKGFSDKAEYRCEGGEIMFKFVVNQAKDRLLWYRGKPSQGKNYTVDLTDLEDLENSLKIKQDSALKFRVKFNFIMARYKEAIIDITKLLNIESNNKFALRYRAEA